VETLLGASADSLRAIFDWTLFLTGTAVYDARRKSIQQAELFYLPYPEARGTAGKIRNSPHRHHTTLAIG
jgi:hypothetical protein